MFFKLILKLIGWKIVINNNPHKSSVVAVFPHTSFLEGVIGFIAMKMLNIKFKVISAEWLFFFPFKYIMKYVLHAFPVGKNSRNAITKSSMLFNDNPDMHLIICPEGRLRAIDKWPMGFYLIAKRANVDIDVAIFNYKDKIIYVDNIKDMSTKESVLKEIHDLSNKYAYAKYPEKYKLPKIK